MYILISKRMLCFEFAGQNLFLHYFSYFWCEKVENKVKKKMLVDREMLIYLPWKLIFIRCYYKISVRCCGNIYIFSYFWSYSHVNVHHCGNIYFIFGQVQKLKFVFDNFFFMFTNFSIYSFSHLDSVKWITLLKFS